jgi:hypothetical protein
VHRTLTHVFLVTVKELKEFICGIYYNYLINRQSGGYFILCHVYSYVADLLLLSSLDCSLSDSHGMLLIVWFSLILCSLPWSLFKYLGINVLLCNVLYSDSLPHRGALNKDFSVNVHSECCV